MTETWTDERLDRLTNAVESTSARLDNFIVESSHLFTKLTESQTRNDVIFAQLGESQARNDANLKNTNDKLDNFIFEASRLFTKLGEGQARTEAATETLLQAIARLTQSEETQWKAIREMQTEVRGLQVENRRILQRVFGLSDDEF